MQHYYRIRNQYNGQVTAWQPITEANMKWLKEDAEKRGVENLEFKVEKS